jgi:uncharacterized protein (UPF0332 family)
MHMNPAQFCDVAGFLLAAKPTESAAIRSAVSRAYYALYHVVARRLVEAGIQLPTKKPECHELVYRILSGARADELKKVALSLNDLRHQRNRADYDLDDEPIESVANAKTIVEKTSKRISTFNTLCEDKAVMTSNWNAMRDAARRERLVVSER